MGGAQRIKRVTESIINLPTLPTVISKLIDLVDNPKTSTTALASLISTDQVLTARILKLANSAYYGFSREIATVNMAIVVLGFNTVKETGLSLSVLEMFKDDNGSGGLFDITKFWEHSMGCGIAAKVVARKCAPAIAGEVFVGGLLHDIGKIILKNYFSEDFKKIMDLVKSDACSLDQAEMRIVETDHGEIGSWLANRWKLPAFIVEGIANHHKPHEAKQKPVFSAIIGLGDYLCHQAGIGASGRKRILEPGPELWEILEQAPIPLSEDAVDNLLNDFFLEYDKSESFVSFINEKPE